MAKPETHFMTRVADKLTLDVSCWTWTGNVSPQGYGRLWWRGEKQQTHRLFYEFFRGQIPEGLHLDHLCRNRSCCNPDHLEPVTNQENNKRGAQHRVVACPSGHPYDATNTKYLPNGNRYCRSCNNERARINRLRQKGLAP